MASRRLIDWIDRTVWILVYGGFFSILLGWVGRRDDSALGILMMAVGAVAAVAGVVLVGVRSHLHEPPPARTPGQQGKT